MNYPDNTLEAFQSAIDLGVDGVEMDVQETADGNFIVFHDSKLCSKDIMRLSLTEIKKVWLQSEYEIPSLEQVLELCNRKIKLFIELKTVRSLDKLLNVLSETMSVSDNMVLSFNEVLLLNLSRLSSNIPTAHITAFPFRDVVKLAVSSRCRGIVVLYPFINEKLLERARIHGLSIYVWGCPNSEAVDKVMQFDMDGIITDFPHVVKEQIEYY